MNDRADNDQPAITDAEVDAVLAEFGDDAREAIRGLLHDVEALARGFEGQVSRGYVRGRVVGVAKKG